MHCSLSETNPKSSGVIMDKVTINGTVMKMELQDAEVINYGTIMHLAGSNVSVRNNGTIMHGGGQTRIVYRDRYITNPQAEAEVRRLKEELDKAKRKLTSAYAEVRTLRERVKVLEATPKTDVRAKQIAERLQCALEVNHEQAKRIKELERGVCDSYLQQQIDPWDIRPTKEQCARLLRRVESYIDFEENI